MSISRGFMGALASGALLGVLGGCVANSSGVQGPRLSDNFVVYAPFDNERDWGPSYLVGPPAHHLGDETRVDDMRVDRHPDPRAAADPDRPPTPDVAPPPPAQLPP